MAAMGVFLSMLKQCVGIFQLPPLVVCDFDLTFDFAVVTLSLKLLSGLYFGNHKVLEVDIW